MTENVLPFIVATGATAALCSALTPVAARVARRWSLVVQPREDRWHRSSTPLLGGAAIALSVLLVLAALPPQDGRAVAVLAGAAAAFALGLLDDFRHLAPATKLVGQALVGSLLVVGGVRVEIVPIAPLAFVLTVLWVVALMNAINLMDNMDGLAAGVSAIAALVVGVTALRESPLAALVAGATAGASLGFLLHNFHPARVFMGDAGSLLLGFLLAAAALLHTAGSAATVGLAVLGPLAVLALPIFDAVLVATTRHLSGQPISRGGRDHTSHRLARLGLSDREAVLFLYVVAAVLGALGMTAGFAAGITAPLLALGVVTLVLLGVFLYEVDIYPRAERGAARARSPISRALSVYGRFGTEVALDVVLLTTAYYVAYLVRFEGVPESSWMALFTKSVPLVIGAQLATLVVLGVYRTLWRYLGIADVVHIVRALTAGTALAALVVLVAYHFEGYSRAVFLLDWLFASVLVVGSRAFLLWLQHWFAARPRAGDRRVLIVGATESGSLALRLLRRSPEVSHRAVGFLDDDPGKQQRRIMGIPVVGTTEDLERVAEELRVDLVVVALEDLASPAADRSRRACVALGIECREFLVPV